MQNMKIKNTHSNTHTHTLTYAHLKSSNLIRELLIILCKYTSFIFTFTHTIRDLLPFSLITLYGFFVHIHTYIHFFLFTYLVLLLLLIFFLCIKILSFSLFLFTTKAKQIKLKKKKENNKIFYYQHYQHYFCASVVYVC